MINKKKINIVYLLPASKKPSGGAKVVYEYSDIINKFQVKSISSQIVHLKKKSNIKIIDSFKKKFFFKKKNEYGWKSHRRAAMESFSQGGLEFSWSHDTVCNPTIQDLIRRQLLYNEGNLFLPREESEGFLNSNEQVHHQFVQELINRKKQSRQI